MRKKTCFRVIVIASFVISMMVLFATLPAIAAKGVDTGKKLIKVAVVGPLTGPYGVFGQDQKGGIEFGIKEFNGEGGFKKGKYKGYKIEANYFDDKSDPKESANVAQQVVVGDYFAELGPVTSSAALASAPIYYRNNMPMVVVFASDYRLTHLGYKNLFRVTVTTSTDGEVLAESAIKILKKKKIGEIWENSAYGQSAHQFFTDSVKKLGAEIAASETFVSGQDVDFKPILTKMKGLNPDCLCLLVNYNDGGLIVSQARGLGWGVPMVASAGCHSPKFLEMMPAVPGEVYMFVTFNQLSNDPKIKDFLKKYRAVQNTEPSEASALAYDALWTLIYAMEMGATERETVPGYLKNVDFQGVTKRIRFDENGDVTQPTFPLLKLGPDKKWLEYK